MTAPRLVIALLAASTLAGCAATRAPPSPPLTVTTEVIEPSTPYGLFLAGRAAVRRGDAATAANLFERASSQEGDAPFLRQQAFEAALASGNITRAAELAPQGRDAADDSARQLGVMVRGVEALAEGHGADAYNLLTSEDIGLPHRAAVALLIPWTAAAAGRTTQSLVPPAVGGDAVARYFGLLGRAVLLERAGRFADAEPAYRGLVAQVDLDGLATQALGGFLERRGRWRDAVAAYEAAMAATPNEPQFAFARARAQQHRVRPPMPTPLQGAAQALVGPAQALMVMRRTDLALDYLRMTLRLDPDRADALVLLGDLLNAQGDASGARAAYDRVAPGSPQYFVARSKLAWSYFRGGETDRAIAEARTLAAAAPVSSGASLTLAELLRTQGHYDEAAAVITRVIDDPASRRDWRLFYMRANDREEGGRSAEAQADLQQGLVLSPQQPELLNFLAYTWIERGERLDEAMAMVQQAAAANPESGQIQDSLGWGYYRQGQFANAVEALERATLLEPANAKINDHLGDAYWRVGRHTEAVFQWRRVLSLEPDARTRAAAEAKIASPRGPDAAPAAAPAASAS